MIVKTLGISDLQDRDRLELLSFFELDLVSALRPDTVSISVDSCPGSKVMLRAKNEGFLLV